MKGQDQHEALNIRLQDASLLCSWVLAFKLIRHTFRKDVLDFGMHGDVPINLGPMTTQTEDKG